MLRSAAVTKALQRSAWHYSQAANLAWRLYRSPAEGVWQGLHRVYRYAAEQRLHARPAEDAGGGNQETVLGLYVQALLMSVANPLAYSQSEQDTLWQLARSFSGACPMQRSPQHDRAACVPEDADQGPGQRLEDENDPLWLDLRALSDEVSAAMARSHDGIAAVIPGSGMGIEVSVEALQRVQRAFGMAAARAHRRRLAGHMLQTVFGMSALHFYLAGRRDFDTFVRQVANDEHHDHGRASWAVATTDAAKVPLFPARVLDQSLGGYRLSWDQAQLIRARVGELIGINLAEDGGDPDWMLGVVRWLRYEPGDTLAAGVELLSRRTLAIGLRTEGTPGAVSAKAPVRALAFASMEAGAGISYLAACPIPASPVRIGIMRNPDDDDSLEHLPGEILARVERVLAMGDYTLLKPLPSELVAKAAVLAEANVAPVEAALPVEVPDTFAEVDTPVEPVADDAVAEIPLEPVDAFAEPDEPLELLVEFSSSYELIEPIADADADAVKAEDDWDIDRDFLR